MNEDAERQIAWVADAMEFLLGKKAMGGSFVSTKRLLFSASEVEDWATILRRALNVERGEG